MAESSSASARVAGWAVWVPKRARDDFRSHFDVLVPHMGMHISIAEQLNHFRFGHLPENLRRVSVTFCLQAVHAVRTIPSGPGLTRALGHLRRAKDEAVTAAISAGKSDAEIQETAQMVIAEADDYLAKHGSPFMVADAAP